MSLSRRVLFSLMFALLAVFSFHSAKAIPATPASNSGQSSMTAAPEKEDPDSFRVFVPYDEHGNRAIRLRDSAGQAQSM